RDAGGGRGPLRAPDHLVDEERRFLFGFAEGRQVGEEQADDPGLPEGEAARRATRNPAHGGGCREHALAGGRREPGAVVHYPRDLGGGHASSSRHVLYRRPRYHERSLLLST